MQLLARGALGWPRNCAGGERQWLRGEAGGEVPARPDTGQQFPQPSPAAAGEMAPLGCLRKGAGRQPGNSQIQAGRR